MFYGSQTGTAEEFATRLCKEARYYGISAMSADPIEYDVVSDLGTLCDLPLYFIFCTYLKCLCVVSRKRWAVYLTSLISSG